MASVELSAFNSYYQSVERVKFTYFNMSVLFILLVALSSCFVEGRSPIQDPGAKCDVPGGTKIVIKVSDVENWLEQALPSHGVLVKKALDDFKCYVLHSQTGM